MRLKNIRESLGMSQQEISSYLHISQNTYSQYETGKRQLPVDTLVKLAVYFHVSVDYILDLTDDPRPYTRKK